MNAKEKVTAFWMWIASVPITAKGVDTLAHGAITVLGVGTATLGFAMAVCGFVWWIRRLRRQRIKLQVEEMQLRVWMQGHAHKQHRTHRPRGDSEETPI